MKWWELGRCDSDLDQKQKHSNVRRVYPDRYKKLHNVNQKNLFLIVVQKHDLTHFGFTHITQWNKEDSLTGVYVKCKTPRIEM